MVDMKDSILFSIKVHSVVDIITNSSSELFVGKNKSFEALKALILDIYPNYLDEYHELRPLSEIRVAELMTYLNYDGKLLKKVSNEFKKVFDVYSFARSYSEEIEFYTLNKSKIINIIDPSNDMFLLFSKSDNPNWEYQEALSDIMRRYHLG